MGYFLFFVGIEGSGHHMMHDCLSSFLRTKKNIKANFELISENAFSTASFPYGKSRDEGKRPNLPSIFNSGVSTKIILLYRNPVDASYSAFRRFHHDPIEQGILSDINLRYIQKNLLKYCPPTLGIKYEKFVQKPESYVKELANFLECEEGLVAKDIRNVKPRSSRNFDDPSLHQLRAFFTNRAYPHLESLCQ